MREVHGPFFSPIVSGRFTKFAMTFLFVATATSKYDELETLYGNIGKVIFDGLTNYERYFIPSFPVERFQNLHHFCELGIVTSWIVFVVFILGPPMEPPLYSTVL